MDREDRNSDEAAGDASRRPFRWRDHPWKIAVGSPCLAAAVSLTIAVVHRFAASINVPDELLIFAYFGNGLLAVAGSVAGGLLVRDTIGNRLLAACLLGGFGFLAYCALLCGVASIASTFE